MYHSLNLHRKPQTFRPFQFTIPKLRPYFRIHQKDTHRTRVPRTVCWLWPHHIDLLHDFHDLGITYRGHRSRKQFSLQPTEFRAEIIIFPWATTTPWKIGLNLNTFLMPTGCAATRDPRRLRRRSRSSARMGGENARRGESVRKYLPESGNRPTSCLISSFNCTVCSYIACHRVGNRWRSQPPDSRRTSLRSYWRPIRITMRFWNCCWIGELPCLRRTIFGTSDFVRWTCESLEFLCPQMGRTTTRLQTVSQVRMRRMRYQQGARLVEALPVAHKRVQSHDIAVAHLPVVQRPAFDRLRVIQRTETTGEDGNGISGRIPRNVIDQNSTATTARVTISSLLRY